ncbi:MAG TPA: DUF1980 domain-containing protein [Chthoniobacteraceae bacterium]|jgi:uncharacterized repeat protein (TIGR03943 family)
MNKLFSRWLPCLTLATWSAILLIMFFTGRVRDLLAPEFRIGVLLAGIIMGLMAAAFVLFPADASCCSSRDCGHGLSRLASGKVLTFLILLLPISAAAMFSPEGFSANAVRNRGVITDASVLGAPRRSSSGAPKPLDLPLPTKDPAPSASAAVSTQPPAPEGTAAGASFTLPAPAADYLQRTPEGHIAAEVMDLLYAAQDNALRRDFEGKTVQLVAQLMPDAENNASGKRFKAVRMFMTCCAADARPVATLVESDKKLEVGEMSWIKITGTATFPLENGRRISLLKASRVEPTSPPDESMLY